MWYNVEHRDTPCELSHTAEFRFLPLHMLLSNYGSLAAFAESTKHELVISNRGTHGQSVSSNCQSLSSPASIPPQPFLDTRSRMSCWVPR